MDSITPPESVPLSTASHAPRRYRHALIALSLAAIAGCSSNSPPSEQVSRAETTEAFTTSSTWIDAGAQAFVYESGTAAGSAIWHALAAGPNGDVYAISTGGTAPPKHYVPGGSWTAITGPSLPSGDPDLEISTATAGSSTGVLWTLSTDFSLYTQSGSSWTTVTDPSQGHGLSLGPNGDAWIIEQTCTSSGSKTTASSCTGAVYYSNPVGSNWTAVSSTGISGAYDAVDLSVSPQGTPWLINSTNNEIYVGSCNGATCTWQQQGDGEGYSISAGSNGSAWAVGTNLNVYYWDPIAKTWQMTANPNGVVDITVTPQGQVFGANATSGQVFYLQCGGTGQTACQNGTASGWCSGDNTGVTSASPICEQCPSPLVSQGGYCIDCPPGQGISGSGANAKCATCSSPDVAQAGVCSECPPGEGISGSGANAKCATCSSPDVAQAGVCSECPPGEGISGSGANAKCATCSGNYYPSGGRCVQEPTCPAVGETATNGTCACPSGEWAVAEPGTLSEGCCPVSGGYTWNGSECVAPSAPPPSCTDCGDACCDSISDPGACCAGTCDDGSSGDGCADAVKRPSARAVTPSQSLRR